MAERKIIFLDKDGTLIPDIPYNVDPTLIHLYPGVRAALPLLQKAGYEFIIVTNQSGVAKGYFKEEKLQEVRDKMEKLFAHAGVPLLDFFYCPHGNNLPGQKGCGCRKPSTGMLRRAALKYELELQDCWMIGDILNDVEAGNRASCKTIFLDRGNESFNDVGYNEYRIPHLYATHFMDLAHSLIYYDKKTKKHEKHTVDTIV